MSVEAIVGRILQDAQTEAEGIIADAEKRAAEIVEKAKAQAERAKQGTIAETKEKVKNYSDGKKAAARLDGAKILLAKKHGVLDKLYKSAEKGLQNLKKADAVGFYNRLLETYAEKGDEVQFAENFSYAAEVAELSVIKKRELKISFAHGAMSGGFYLKGATADKNLSFEALLDADRQQYQADMAAEIFKL